MEKGRSITYEKIHIRKPVVMVYMNFTKMLKTKLFRIVQS